jgi:hypothetical protein
MLVPQQSGDGAGSARHAGPAAGGWLPRVLGRSERGPVGARQRREVLALGLGAVSGVLLPAPALGRDDVVGGLDELLFGTPQAEVVAVSRVGSGR